MDRGAQQQAQRVDQDVPLLALDLLARVVTARIDVRPPFSALLTLWLSMIAAVGLAPCPPAPGPGRRARGAAASACHPRPRAWDSRGPCSSAADPWAGRATDSRSPARRGARSAPRARPPCADGRRASRAG